MKGQKKQTGVGAEVGIAAFRSVGGKQQSGSGSTPRQPTGPFCPVLRQVEPRQRCFPSQPRPNETCFDWRCQRLNLGPSAGRRGGLSHHAGPLPQGTSATNATQRAGGYNASVTQANFPDFRSPSAASHAALEHIPPLAFSEPCGERGNGL